MPPEEEGRIRTNARRCLQAPGGEQESQREGKPNSYLTPMFLD